MIDSITTTDAKLSITPIFGNIFELNLPSFELLRIAFLNQVAKEDRVWSCDRSTLKRLREYIFLYQVVSRWLETSLLLSGNH